MNACDVLIVGAGAAGLMCAIEAGKRGRRVVLIDHTKKIGEKIRISGGGRCNFTNRHTSLKNFLSSNPRFCISALKRYTQEDFIALVDQHQIAWHEKMLGQLFCDGSARQIIDMLLTECQKAKVRIFAGTEIESVDRTADGFSVSTSEGLFGTPSLVIATGGKSIPKIGATGFAYDIARQFEIDVIEPRPGLVPFTFQGDTLEAMASLSGVSAPSIVSIGKDAFSEAMLFTHRGLSGPAILQISSYWREGDAILIDLAPDTDVFGKLRLARTEHPKQSVATALSSMVPARLAENIARETEAGAARIADLSDKRLKVIAERTKAWRVTPAGTEGYRTAEVTLGGIDTNELSSQTFEARAVPGLHFIGEAVDVTGHLGGFNFQWAWSSGWCAGQAV